MSRVEQQTILESAACIGLASVASMLLVLARMESLPKIYESVQTNRTTLQISLKGGNFGWINSSHLYVNITTGCVPEMLMVKGKPHFQMFVMNHSLSVLRRTDSIAYDYMRNTSSQPWQPQPNDLAKPITCVLENMYSPVSTILRVGRLEQQYFGTSRLLTTLAEY